MTPTNLPQRERLLSLWAQNRLGERETVEWAVTALMQIRGELGAGTVALFDFLESHAHESADLSQTIKKVWNLLRIVAKESADQPNSLFMYEIRERINNRTVRSDDVDRLIDCFRPRLRATELSSWRKSDEEVTNDPMRWVHWRFKTSLHSSYQPSARLTRSQLAKLPHELLSRLIERGTSALREALNLAQAIGWTSDKRDLPNNLVHRVFIPEAEESQSNEAAADDDRDPDGLNNDFAPIVRLLSGALDTLAEKNIGAAATAAKRWKEESGGLFLRLFAFAAWHANIVTGSEVAAFLDNIDDHVFWRWIVFPEVATLRAVRWNDLPREVRFKIEMRLINGPNNQAFRIENSVPEATKQFHRDHELARLTDNGCEVPPEFRTLVDARRTQDSKFSRRIPTIEAGLPGARVVRLPEGKPEKFAQVPATELLAALTDARERHEFGQGDDAEAFARTLIGKRRILEALDAARVDGDQVHEAWKLLLSFPHEKSEDTSGDRQLAEHTARLALGLWSTFFARIADQLCYWLDGTDERTPKFEGADQLWFALLPYAVAQANSCEDQTGDAGAEVDLTLAALNEPLGHLLSLFLRRCPDMPAAKDERPPLPSKFVSSLKQLTGRARELLANRIAIQMNYFALADRNWLDEVVVSPMTVEGRTSDRIWEGFAKYGRVPPPEIWCQLQRFVFRRLSSFQLSPEAKRHLAEMSVIVWIWSKEESSPFKFDSANFRTALGLTNDDMRGAAAWQFSAIFRSKHDKEDGEQPSATELWPRLGAAFFHEVWPLEPTLQSAATANDFARIPGNVGPRYFADAVRTVLPYLQPFEVWAVLTELQLDPQQPETDEIVRTFPEETLNLLAICISEKQQHGVYGLKKILDRIVAVRPDLQRDHRMRWLRKLALDND
jgi:hypothetical protein